MKQSNNEMIELKINNMRFKYRVVGVALNNNHVLIQTVPGYNFWALPGGRAEFFEDSMATLKREMKEELEQDITVGRLIWIVENFYEDAGVLVHELAMYYLMEFPRDASVYEKDEPFIGHDDGYDVTFQWYPIDKLQSINLCPEFLQQSLQTIPMGTEHVVLSDFQETN